MLKKILIGILIVLSLIIMASAVLYWKFRNDNKPPISDEDREQLTIMPLPASAELKDDFCVVNGALGITWTGVRSSRLNKALQRFARRVDIPFDSVSTDLKIILSVTCQRLLDTLSLEVDESYSLKISADKIELTAPRETGILRGLESLTQLAVRKKDELSFQQLTLEDHPRYPWRGLLIDVCRHWMPKEIILRNLDAMAALKLNVLHWHLSDHQGFRVESKLFPKLHELGSEGNYYSQNEIREVVRYAADRGIRVVPEFDMPGHSTSWLVGYPELAALPGPFTLERTLLLSNVVMDPTREEVYQFIDQFIGEMTTLFPDEYFHMGGDEVSPVAWNENKNIQQFMADQNLKTPRDLQNYFNKRVHAMLKKYNRKMVGWDEILHPDLSTDIMVQCWRNHKLLFDAVQKKSDAIMSKGYYLDLKLSAGKHYSVDPEILPGAITIKPDTVLWSQYDLKLSVSGNEMDMQMVLYGKDETLRGLFIMMENATGFEHAAREQDHLDFSFQSDFGEVDVTGDFRGDSVSGKMGLGLLSFPFRGVKVGGNDMADTKPPHVEQIKPLLPEEKARIKGGEAAVWAELITDRNIDSRIWPRMAAIAEKLWSPAVLTKNEDDMYRRLEVVSEYLSRLGIRHESGYMEMLRELSEGKPVENLKVLTDILEEVKNYDRMTIYPQLTTLLPLNEVVDAVHPESYPAYRFNKMVREFVKDSTHSVHAAEIEKALILYRDNDPLFQATFNGNKRLERIFPVSGNVRELSIIGLQALDRIKQNIRYSEEEKKLQLDQIQKLTEPQQGVIIAIAPGIRQLVE
ncbi:MAG TPA: beta-N-acetylhexosaminidase [Ohtaekwangia sp.]